MRWPYKYSKTKKNSFFVKFCPQGPRAHDQILLLRINKSSLSFGSMSTGIDWKKVDKRPQIIYWKKVDKFRHFKNNTIPADVIPNDSEDLFILSNSNWSWALGPWGTGDKISQKKSSYLFWNIYTASASSRILVPSTNRKPARSVYLQPNIYK